MHVTEVIDVQLSWTHFSNIGNVLFRYGLGS